jgi:hypothetical protein
MDDEYSGNTWLICSISIVDIRIYSHGKHPEPLFTIPAAPSVSRLLKSFFNIVGTIRPSVITPKCCYRFFLFAHCPRSGERFRPIQKSARLYSITPKAIRVFRPFFFVGGSARAGRSRKCFFAFSALLFVRCHWTLYLFLGGPRQRHLGLDCRVG